MQHERIADLAAMTWLDLLDWLSAPDNWARSAMVTSLAGGYADTDGSSRGLSGADDLRVLQALRASSDVVLVGLRTAVQEGYQAGRLPADLRLHRPNGPRLAVVSRTLMLPPDGPLHEGEHPVIVITEEQNDKTWRQAANEVSEAFDLVVSAEPLCGRSIRSLLQTRGLTRLLCEGGPSVQQLMRADGSIDEICLSVAFALGGRSEPGNGALGAVPTRYDLTAAAVSPQHAVLRLQAQHDAPTLVA